MATSSEKKDFGSETRCAVCGEENAKMHYGVLACLGCKGFFRRALKKVNEYECLRDNNCVIDKQERNSCRFCRLQKCLEVGMDPAAVRPDRDFSGQQQLLTRRLSLSAGGGTTTAITTTTSSSSNTTNNNNNTRNATGAGGTNRREKRRGRQTTALGNNGGAGGNKAAPGEDGRNGQRMPVEMRTMLMTLQNIEAKVVRGDTVKDASEIYPLHINTIREVINDPAKLRGLRTTIRYEPYRMARNEELCVIVYRRLIAAIDWVELLAERMGGLSTEDRIALVKACFGPLTLFKCSARTASVTENENMLCLCNFAYVPREISKAYSDAYHLDNGLVERLLNDLVGPFRRIHLTEEEVICLSAIIVLNPMARDLSEHAAELCFQLRNRICATLYHIVKECRADCNPNIWFGNLLLFLPIVASLANAMCENLRFAQTFSLLGGIPLLTSLFGCFPVEPFTASESEMAALGDVSNADKDDAGDNNNLNNLCASHQRKASTERGTQTDAGHLAILHDQLGRARKRRLCPSDSLAEEGTDDFRLFKAPCSYTLTEMFDDRINEEDAKDNDDEIMVTSAENDGITTTAAATCSSSSQTGTDRKSREVQAAIQDQQQTGNTNRSREVHAVQYQLQQQQQQTAVNAERSREVQAVQYQLQQQQQQTAGNAERSREVQAVQYQLQQQQQQTAVNAERSREVQAVQYQLQQQQQQTAGNAGRGREVQAAQHLHDQHKHNHHVQPPSTQIQQLCLYDGSSSTSATSCRANATTTASTLGMPSKFTAGTNLQEQQQISYPQMAQPYGMGMPSTMACQNWAPIAYHQPDHYHQQQYYGEFWHHQQNPGICATNSNLSQLIWPTTAMAPTVPSASTTTFSGQMPMVKQCKRRATLASVSTSAVP